MEGLIPMVFKSLKKNKTRRKYECLSLGAAQNYNIQDFYMKDDNDQDYYFSKKENEIPEPEKLSGLNGARHRRYNSVHVEGVRSFGFGENIAAAEPKRLVRFSSQRILSCVTGA